MHVYVTEACEAILSFHSWLPDEKLPDISCRWMYFLQTWDGTWEVDKWILDVGYKLWQLFQNLW